MKLRQMLKKQKKKEQIEKKQKRMIMLDDALKKLVELNIACWVDGKLKYSADFTATVESIKDSPPSKMTQLRLGNQAGRKLIPQILSMALTKPSRVDIENMIAGFVCLSIHLKEKGLDVEKKLLPDLAYGVWYLNDHEPTLEEINEWTLHK